MVRLLLAVLLLLAGEGWAKSNPNTIKPEMTPPPAEGALTLKDLAPVYARALPEAKKKTAEQAVSPPAPQQEEKKVMADAEKQEMKQLQQGFDALQQVEGGKGKEVELGK